MGKTALLINDTPHSAAYNMAADLYLLSLCETTESAFIRIYSWEKPSITLGTMEKAAETLDIDKCNKDGVEWIRRSTGGRSVLHDCDITYSCVFSSSHSCMGSTLMESYRIISDCLMQGLSYAKIPCVRHDAPLDNTLFKSNIRFPCFLSPNRHEIMVQAKKLVGSAQKRTAKAVLQHGSIPLSTAFRNLPTFLQLTEEDRLSQINLLLQKTICVQEIIPSCDDREIRASLIRGFTEQFPLPVTVTSWSQDNLEAIAQLSQSKEFLDSWHPDR